MKTIGFIGLGVMGRSMVRNLIKNGYPAVLYTRTKAKAGELLREGAEWRDTPREVAEASDVIITMVGYPHDVESVYFGNKGIFEGAGEGKIVIDMTTSTPTLAKKISDEALKYGMAALDAPVSGGDIGAKNGTLSIMAGGSEKIFNEVRSIFSVLGNNIVFHGGAGAGQHAKMCNQIAIASNMIGVTEALVYARKAGLDAEKMLESISTGAAGSWSLSNLIPRVLKEDYSPGFFIKHFIKDMGIAIEEAKKMELELPGLELAQKMYQTLAAKGEEDSGTQALIKYWSK
ncbi:NAD(P)-dependent oxidoreductase [Siminovitchia sediminis]|uniref:NAD(P)-dependent oxidoreductase n=1 Tax=Siminovitchia sediminis TaxID=1274353 RepID=A0ABW4KBZ9_9BACI